MNRWPLRIILCLILGAITTVAVAVAGLQWFLSQDHDFVSYSGDELANEQQARFLQRNSLPAFYDDSEHQLWWYLVLHSMESASVVVEQWDYDAFDYSIGSTPFHFATRTLIGWPASAFEHIHYPSPGTPARAERETIEALYESIITQTGRDWPGFGKAIHPATVAPQAFLIDTLFYGAIWGGVFFGFISAKRFLRARRGGCPRCGYDLRGQWTEIKRSEIRGQR